MSDNFYNQLINQLPVGYAYHKIICDEMGTPCDYVFVEVNEVFEELTGLKGADIIGKPITKVMPEISKSEFDWIALYGEIALKGSKKEFEQFSEPLNRWYRVTAYSPQKGYFITIFADMSNERRQINELKELTEAFQKSESRYRRLAENAKDIIYRINLVPERHYEYVNPAVSDITGYTPEEHYADPDLCMKIVHPEDYHLIEKAWRGEIPSGEPLTMRWVRKDGQVIWIEQRKNLLTNEEGIPVAIEGVARDITVRKKAEEALHESEQFLRSTLDGLSSHIVVINESGEIVLTNKAYRDFAERNKIEHSTVSEGCNYLAVCDTAQGEDSEEAGFFAQGIREVLFGKRPSFELEYPCHSPDEQRWFLGRVTPFKSDSPRRVVIAHENITERKESGEQLSRSVLAQQSLNSFMLELNNINDYDELIKTVVTQTDQLLNPIVTTFSEYDQDARLIMIKEVKTNQNVLDLLVKVGGKKLLSTATPVSNEMHKEIMTDRVKIATTMYEVFGGAVSKFIANRIDKAFKIKCYCGFSYIVDNQAFGTTVIALDREPELYLTELLKNYAHFVSISLKRILSEQALRKTTIEIKTITDNMSDTVSMTDAEGRFTYVSGNHNILFGYSSDELLGRQAWEIVDDEDAGRIANLFSESFSAGQDGQADYRVVRKDGSLVWVETSSSILSDHGKPSGALFVTRDITERKLAEVSLQRFAEELEHQRKDLEKRLNQSVKAISKIGELRDVYTAGHQKRVAELAFAIGKEMGLADEKISNLSYGGLLHDVGKFFVPSDILNKPGQVSDLEYKMLQTHVEESYNVVKEIDFPKEIHTMVYQHHERLDGSGYPQGISGDEIILESRILAVADVVEAMSSHRPYRSAWGIDVALEEIELHKGTRFDADVVDACIRLFTEKKFQFYEK